jgi:hypothetical protein
VPYVEFGVTEDPTKAAAFHLIAMLRELPEPYVVVMTCRNFALETRGVHRACPQRVRLRELGRQGGLRSLVGQEFTRVTPKKLGSVLVDGPGRLPAGDRGPHRGLRWASTVPRGISVDNIDAYEAARR